MGLFDGLLLRASEPKGPGDDFWYEPLGTMTVAGVRMSPEGAKKVSAWFRGREILATTLAMIPLDMFERLPNDEGNERAPQHPLHDVIHRKPAPWLDSFQWRRQAMYHLIDHGNAYAWIKPGTRGVVHELWPIHPTNVVKVDLAATVGRKVYTIRDPKTQQATTHTDSEIFHLCGMSDDGIVGKGILDYAREALGLVMVTEQFAQSVFSRGSMGAGALEVPGTLDPEASKRMAESFITSKGNWHLPKVLEQGAKWVQSQGLTPENAQMLNSRKFGIPEMARYLGVPPHMLFDLDRSTNNNIEHQGQEFLDYTEGQWLSLWEFGINNQLIVRADRFFAEFNRNAFVRGDIATRWAAYVDAITTGTYTRNEVRRMENKRKLEGLDEPLNPAHLTGKPARSNKSQGGATPAPTEAALAAADQFEMRARAIAIESAARLLRKEIAAVQKAAVQHASDGDLFASAVNEFYAKHVDLVMSTLQVSRGLAEDHCVRQAQQIIAGVGIVAVETWQSPTYAAGLAALALEEVAA